MKELTMRSLRTLSFLALLALIFSAPHPCRAANRCQDTADELLFKVKSWSGLHQWFESYADCDDGYLAEGVSDYVVVSLAHRWHDLAKLRRQIERDPRFEAFVLQHVDPTTDSDDLQAIVENATKRCPSHSATFCTSLAGAARKALEEIRGNEGSSPERI